MDYPDKYGVSSLTESYFLAEDIAELLEDTTEKISLRLFFENYGEALDYAGDLLDSYVPLVNYDSINETLRMYNNIKRKLTFDLLVEKANAEATLRDSIPEGIGKIGFDLPLESKLEISGRKSVTVNYGNSFKTNPPAGTTVNSASAPGVTNGFALTQELQVRLAGTVGKRVTVNVDYDDTKQQQRDISLIYKGEG
ncbi:MAG: hypothetical protein WCI43_05105, partial [Candidatus Firestonebacteria bacterium]